MANTIRDYSATAASNTTVDGADISEGCSPAGINDAIRGVMADLKDVSTGAVSLESPAADSLSLSGALTTTSTIDGRDVAADGTKLDGIEASADVTDAGNVNPLVDAHLNQSTAASGELLSWNGSDYDWITAGGSGDLLAANNLSDLANAATARTNLGLGSAATTAASAYATAAQGTAADAALPKAGGAMTGAITTNSTFDGRDVATDGAKLDGIASGANNYVHPNHTGEVTSTGDGATVIADNVVDEANLKVSNAPTNGYFLSAQSGAAGGLTWAAVAAGGADLYAANESSPTAQPSATGGNAIAIGDSAIGSGDDALAGPLSRAAGNGSVALGINSNSTSYGAGGNFSVSLGYQSRAMALQSNAMGSGAYVDSDSRGGLALGEAPYVEQCDYGVAIGPTARVHGGNTITQAMALGPSYSSGQDSLAAQIGNSTSSYGATGNYSVAIGNLAKSTGLNAMSFGEGAIASGNSSLALSDSTASANSAISIGVGATASGSSAVAIGKSANSAHTNSVAIGRNAVTTAIDQITVGDSTATVRISEAYTLPTTDGTSGQVMTTDGAGTVSFTTVSGGGGGGSPDLFDESYDGTSTAPSATGTNSVAIGKGSTASGQESMAALDGNSVSQDSFSLGGNVYANAIGGIQIGKGGIVGGYGFSANYGVSIGYQGIAAKVESIAIGKAYSGGINSFAAQITNNTSSYGATGNNSVVMGKLSKSTGTSGVAIGTQTSSLATEGVSIGTQNTIYSPNGVGIGSTNSVLGTKGVGLGTSTYVSATYGMAFGFQSRAFQQSQFAFAAGNFASFGDAQGSMYILRCATTDATPTVLTTDGGAGANFNQIEVQTDQCLTFDGTITAMQNGAQAFASFRIEGLLVNDGGTTTLVNSATTVIDNQSSWGMAMTADNTNNALAITVTGEASHNIRWVANIRTSEVTYA